MKQIHIIMLVLVSLAVGCAKVRKPNAFVGTWTRQTPYEGEVPTYAQGFTFHEDGSFQWLAQFEENGALVPVGHQGSYSVSNSTLILTVAMSDPNSPSTAQHAFEFPSPSALRISVGETNRTFMKKD